jgi:uncharacterized protein (DUF2141 family)
MNIASVNPIRSGPESDFTPLYLNIPLQFIVLIGVRNSLKPTMFKRLVHRSPPITMRACVAAWSCCCVSIFAGCVGSEDGVPSVSIPAGSAALADASESRLESGKPTSNVISNATSRAGTGRETELPLSLPSRIRVKVTGFAHSKGTCRLAAYSQAKGFHDPDRAIAKSISPIENETVQWEFESPPELTQLAISAFHDSNENEKLDKNSLGIPTERYGFSNNPKRGFGPPTFRESAVALQPALGAPSQVEHLVEISVK